jgi:hypothetical protein
MDCFTHVVTNPPNSGLPDHGRCHQPTACSNTYQGQNQDTPCTYQVQEVHIFAASCAGTCAVTEGHTCFTVKRGENPDGSVCAGQERKNSSGTTEAITVSPPTTHCGTPDNETKISVWDNNVKLFEVTVKYACYNCNARS